MTIFFCMSWSFSWFSGTLLTPVLTQNQWIRTYHFCASKQSLTWILFCIAIPILNTVKKCITIPILHKNYKWIAILFQFCRRYCNTFHKMYWVLQYSFWKVLHYSFWKVLQSIYNFCGNHWLDIIICMRTIVKILKKNLFQALLMEMARNEWKSKYVVF